MLKVSARLTANQHVSEKVNLLTFTVDDDSGMTITVPVHHEESVNYEVGTEYNVAITKARD